MTSKRHQCSIGTDEEGREIRGCGEGIRFYRTRNKKMVFARCTEHEPGPWTECTRISQEEYEIIKIISQ
jgi:hypothetical protein